MSLVVATHSGPFHADDVLAWALIQVFVDAEATVVRTRDSAQIKAADIVIDVGGKYDPEHLRFDHHQASYEGPWSSAGMVLAWLESSRRVDPDVAAILRSDLVDYVDAVDNGRLLPERTTPCFARLVELFAAGPSTAEEYDQAFLRAGEMAAGAVRGAIAEVAQVRAAQAQVVRAMDEAREAGRAVIFLDAYQKWKPVYFAHGGVDHPTAFVLFPGMEGTWRVVAIPPEEHSFAQKRSLPEAWAGLTGSSLAAVTGVEGSLFCHKNRFIAVFTTREAAIEALERHGLLWREK